MSKSARIYFEAFHHDCDVTLHIRVALAGQLSDLAAGHGERGGGVQGNDLSSG